MAPKDVAVAQGSDLAILSLNGFGSNICNSTLVELKLYVKIWKKWRTTSTEEDFNGR